jgi:hypothetical protein
MITWEGLAEVNQLLPRRHLTHAELVERVAGYCVSLQLQAFYWPDSRKAIRKGWPDFAIGGPGGWLFREVKPAFARLSREQRQTGYLMIAGGLNWAVWGEADLESGTVLMQLRTISAKRAV